MDLITINDATINEAVKKHGLEIEVAPDPDFDQLQCVVIVDSESRCPVAALFEIDTAVVTEERINQQLLDQLVTEGLVLQSFEIH